MIPFVGEIVKGASGIIDSLHTSDEERAEARAKLVSLQIAANQQALEHEQARLHEAAETVRTEAKSESSLARNWRPAVMLTFTALVVAHWLGLTPDTLPEAEVMKVLDIVQLGLGGYVIGRSAEKIIPGAIQAMKAGNGSGAAK